MIVTIVMVKLVKTKWCDEAQIGAPLPRAGGQDYMSSNKLPQISSQDEFEENLLLNNTNLREFV